MLAGHLMLSLMASFAALVASLLAGQPWWAALLLYSAAGSLSLIASTTLVALRLPPEPMTREPMKKGAGRPGAPRSHRSRPAQAGSASRALPAMAATASARGQHDRAATGR